jgi:hypothetical protein
MHNEELHNVNSFPNIISVLKENEMGVDVERTGEMRNAYIRFVEPGETWRSCENNIKMDIKKRG